MIEWFDYLFGTSVTTAGLIATFDGVRRLAQTGRDRLGRVLLVLGVVGCSATAAVSGYVSSIMEASARSLDSISASELPDGWGAGQSPAARERNSLLYAASAYVSTGILIQHYDLAGSRKTFAPSSEQLREREKHVALRAELEFNVTYFKDVAFRVLFAMIVAALIGLWVGRTQLQPRK